MTQLLSLMDGLKRSEGVVVVGTTNRLETIDPALRRAGRFDGAADRFGFGFIRRGRSGPWRIHKWRIRQRG